ncbi:5-oxoprolinase subunit PxpB [Belliella marina]|uniref:5-oxoprolinase subunit PxpB n=1 Tax=Belliella marina TaxID=1644146 RepID=A0ABW4VPU0_9BACT
MVKTYFQIHPNLIEIKWPKEINDKILLEQIAVKSFLEEFYRDIILEIRIGFNTLSILFDIEISNQPWDEIWNKVLNVDHSESGIESTTWKIPVCYQGEFAFDLENLAKTKKITTSELITIHCSKPYRLHFYGFLPGFMYLGGLDSSLHCPRKSSPNLVIPKGSVAIGGSQTGIYPMQSPGGWHVIGKTPLVLFDNQKTEVTIAKQGDRIQFQSIEMDEFDFISNQVKEGKYNWENA